MWVKLSLGLNVGGQTSRHLLYGRFEFSSSFILQAMGNVFKTFERKTFTDSAILLKAAGVDN